MNALLSGYLGAFVERLPTNGDGGALPLYAPAALLGKLLSGSPDAIFRFGALACLLALGALGLYLARGMRAAGRPAAERAAVISICVLGPALLDVILYGHPEEALGAALCVGAVLLASEEHVTLAGLALGLALVNKPWGVLAVIPVVLAAPRTGAPVPGGERIGRRVARRLVVAAGAPAGNPRDDHGVFPAGARGRARA